MPEIKWGVLSKECEALLEAHDLQSQRSDGTYAWIMDIEGVYLFRVTLGVSTFDLNNTLTYGSEQFGKGREYGERWVRGQLRDLIGAAPLYPLD